MGGYHRAVQHAAEDESSPLPARSATKSSDLVPSYGSPLGGGRPASSSNTRSGRVAESEQSISHGNLGHGSSNGASRRRSGLERNLANIVHEFPAEGSRFDGRVPEDTSEFQDPMWLMAGLAERGWNLQKSPDARKTVGNDGLVASTSLQADGGRRLLGGWTPQALQSLEKEQSRYYRHGVLGSKCDVAAELDPVQRGLVTEERANELIQV